MHPSQAGPRRRGRRLVAAALLLGALAAAGPGLARPQAEGVPDLADRLQAARDAASRAPENGLQLLQALAAQATDLNDLPARLAASEAQCRVLSDTDGTRAMQVAEAGLAAAVAAGAAVPDAAQEPWLRLRACRAGLALALGQAEQALAELDAVLRARAAQPGSGARAIALLERGVYRSRKGELDAGQQDLLDACAALKGLDEAQTLNLCLGHLANHYKRLGDADEALRLLLPLRDAARRAGADHDHAIYTYGAGQVLQMQGRWADALQAFQDAASASQRLQDRSGEAYAERNIAQVLLQSGQAAQALVHADRARSLLDRDDDPAEHELLTVTRAQALAALDRPGEALPLLLDVQAGVQQRDLLPVRARWLLTRAQALSALGRWREAHASLAEARELEARLHAQQLSQQQARWRMQFNRARDAEELANLRRLNEQGQQLRHTQAVALVLFVLLLAAVMAVALNKVRQARRLHTLASTDELTGVANRRAVLAAVQQALQRARRDGGNVALLMVDVDHFKRINDTHGHATGDAVLRHLVKVMGGTLRSGDHLGRLGGEEFVALLPGSTVAAAQGVAERMRAAIASTPLVQGALTVSFTVSIGVAQASDTDDLGELLDHADHALYRAKDGGRNAVVTWGPAPLAAAG